MELAGYLSEADPLYICWVNIADQNTRHWTTRRSPPVKMEQAQANTSFIQIFFFQTEILERVHVSTLWFLLCILPSTFLINTHVLSETCYCCELRLEMGWRNANQSSPKLWLLFCMRVRKFLGVLTDKGFHLILSVIWPPVQYKPLRNCVFYAQWNRVLQWRSICSLLSQFELADPLPKAREKQG
jgi:hypothetical protein